LIVFGGRGKSASYNGAKAVTFANNEGWHDDTADGPVTAEVTFSGQKLRVDPAWIVVAPPNYGPLQKSVRTMWDLIRDVAITAGTLPKPARPIVRPRYPADLRASVAAAMGECRLCRRVRLGRAGRLYQPAMAGETVEQ
jgi:hypothetical protein